MKIEPDKQFPHSLTTVRSIAERYGCNVVNYREASAGIENTSLIVNTVTHGTLVFRIYRHGKKTAAEIEAELDFMTYLRLAGIAVPKLIANSRHSLYTVFEADGRSWQAIVMEHVSGEHVDTPSMDLLTAMATNQARMHLLTAGYKPPNNATRRLTRLRETEFIQQIDQETLPNELQAFLARGAAYTLDLSNTLPIGLCHMDYDELNMLCENNAITAILDFDDLSVAPYVVCLSYTLWHMHNNGGQAALTSYLAAYEQLRELTADERKVVFPAMLFRHYMITAIKILNSRNSAEDIQLYLETEQYLQSSNL